MATRRRGLDGRGRRRSPQIERELARLRDATSAEGAQPNQRTSVMTHIAWVPPEWLEAAERTLDGDGGAATRRGRCCSCRSPDEADGLDAHLSVRCFPVGDRAVCERGDRADAARRPRVRRPRRSCCRSLISDLPVFLRWRGEPPFGAPQFEQLVDVADRLVVDSSEWEELRATRELARALRPRGRLGHRVGADGRAGASQLARCWPGIASRRSACAARGAEAHLLRGWLRVAAAPRRSARSSQRERARASTSAARSSPAARAAATPSDLLSAELDRFGRDRVYEAGGARGALALADASARPASDRRQSRLTYERATTVCRE